MAGQQPNPIPDYLADRLQAKRRGRMIQFVCVLSAIACIVASGFLVNRINAIRSVEQLNLDPEELGSLPPEIVLATNMGTLRALAIDVAFIRAEKLKEEGRFFELMQLMEWLCKLAPRYPSVWQNNAWNQAYNISVCEYTPEGRWLWVNNGIKLLRDKGIKYNPKEIGLYRELGYIYWHKIGDLLDDMHWRYKAELAMEIELVLGARPPFQSTEDYIEWFRKIAESPDDPALLIDPDSDQYDEAVAAFVKEIEKVELEPDESLLEFVARYIRPEVSLEQITFEDEDQQQLFNDRIELLTDEKRAPAREKLIACTRKNILSTVYKLNTDWMLTLLERYGPIDWRSPFAHAMYWATWGDMVTKGKLDMNDADSMNVARFIMFGLNKLWQEGMVVFEPNWEKPNRSAINYMPDIRFIEPLNKAYIEIGKEQFGDDPRYVEGTAGPNYRTGHQNALQQAIRQLYFRHTPDSLAQAERYYKYLREYDLDDRGNTKPQYLQPMKSFVLNELSEHLQIMRNAIMFIGEFLASSLRQLSIEDLDGSMGYLEMAKLGWNIYMEDMKTDEMDRRKLDPITTMYRDAVFQFMGFPGYTPLQKSRLWKNLDLNVRQDVWDKLVVYFDELCAAQTPPWDRRVAFPTPPGMKDARDRERDQRVDETEDVNQGVKSFEY